eukprot:scaffold271176_cov40-Prasinocladus_malaysianus.AAC.1
MAEWRYNVSNDAAVKQHNEFNDCHGIWSLRDPDGVDFMLMAELARHAPDGKVKIHEPCLTAFAMHDACGREEDPSTLLGEAACGAMPLSDSAICKPNAPLPQPRVGYCSDPSRKQAPANCFR